MKVLLVKTSSLGDVVHALPAVTDAARALPGLELDWVVEEGFAEIPGWHPAVRRVLPVALRRWRRTLLKRATRKEIVAARRAIAAERYDVVLDAQGLVKSAWLARGARGVTHGLDRASIREPLASLAYRHRHRVPRQLHAVERVRRLFAAAVDYPLPSASPDYGVPPERFDAPRGARYLFFLHGTTWDSKAWPEAHWRALAALAAKAGYEVRLSYGNAQEEARARRLAAAQPGVRVLGRGGLAAIAGQLAGASGVVGVDTGLAHVAAMLAVPQVVLYGPTVPGLTGTVGRHQAQLLPSFECTACLRRTCGYQAPVQPACLAAASPAQVWARLQEQMGAAGGQP